MSDPQSLSNEELRDELKTYGFSSGPVSEGTRSVMEKKLIKLRSAGTPSGSRPASQQRTGRSPGRPRKTPTTPSSSGNASSSRFSLPDNNVTPPRHEPKKSPSPRRPASRNSSGSSRSSRSNIPSPVVIAAAEQSDNEQQLDLTPSPKASYKRTPTPPRPNLYSQRTSSNRRNIISDRPVSTRRQQYPNTDDDSMETSRVLTPNEKRNFSTRSTTYTSVPRRQPPTNDESPIDKLKRYGSTAYQYIQDRANNLTYVRHPSERGKYGTPGGRISPAFGVRPASPSNSSEVPKYLLMIFGSFTVVLLLAYVFTAHQKTVERTNRLIAASVKDTVNFVYNYAVFPAIMVALFVGAALITFFVYKRRKVAREQLERRTMELVDRIADRVRNAGDDGIAEQHLRDTLLPPTRRTAADLELWLSAVQFINDMDSRIRSESRLINGIECNVWIWVNATDPSRGWQGPVERVSPRGSNTPAKALTRCLKMRGMVDGSTQYDAEIKREVYSQLRPIRPIHFAINHQPADPSVYLMFADYDDTKSAFDIFHSNWFRGNLVTVKYVRDERYAERFPEMVGK